MMIIKPAQPAKGINSVIAARRGKINASRSE